ncbi:unnamed protein product, partial [Cyprideis torosa]
AIGWSGHPIGATAALKLLLDQVGYLYHEDALTDLGTSQLPLDVNLLGGPVRRTHHFPRRQRVPTPEDSQLPLDVNLLGGPVRRTHHFPRRQRVPTPEAYVEPSPNNSKRKRSQAQPILSSESEQDSFAIAEGELSAKRSNTEVGRISTTPTPHNEEEPVRPRGFTTLLSNKPSAVPDPLPRPLSQPPWINEDEARPGDGAEGEHSGRTVSPTVLPTGAIPL